MLRMSKAAGTVVVLGFGAAAVSAVRALRAEGYEGRIAVVTDGGPAAYSPVLTSYYAAGAIERDRCFEWAGQDAVDLVDDLRPHARVAGVDAASHEVLLADGGRLRYDKLLVATGAHPVAPGFPTPEGYLPLALRTMDDARRLREALSSAAGASVLVCGTSMVGLKVLEACLARDARVTMLGRSPQILRGSAHPAAARRLQGRLAEKGVALRLSQEVAEAREDAGGCRVRFDGGDTERFDQVVLAQGVRPNTGFMPPGMLAESGGLEVDSFMRANAPDVFAAGDVACALDLSTGAKRIIGLWQNAIAQGRCAGRAMAAELAGRNPTRPYPGSIPSNVIHVDDILFASAGRLPESPDAEIAVVDNPDEVAVFARSWCNGTEQLVGFNVLSVAPGGQRRALLEERVGCYRAEVLKALSGRFGQGAEEAAAVPRASRG